MKKIIPLIILLVIVTAGFSQVSRNGLLAVYKFDGNFNDSTANNRHALWANVTFVDDRNSDSNSAISFNGDDGFLTSYIGSHQDITVAYWFKPDNQVDPYPHMFDYGDYKFRGMILAGSIYGANDRHKVYCGTNYPNEVFTKSANTVSYNQWQHIAYVFDKTNNKIKVYVDGSFSSEATISTSLTPSDSTIMFGRLKNGALSEVTTSNYKGAMDDIYIYGRALSAQEISDLKNGNISALSVRGNNNTVNPEEAIIYPNPTKDGFTVSLKNESLRIASIKVFDISGKLISITLNSNSVNTTDLSAGTYIVQVNGENGTFIASERLVIE